MSGSSDRTVRLWDLSNRQPIGAPLTGHTAEVNAVAVGELNGSTIIASGSSDNTVRIWRTASLDADGFDAQLTINLAASVYGISIVRSQSLICATELGVVSMRLESLQPISGRD